MKAFWMVSFLLLGIGTTFAQVAASESILIVRLNQEYDRIQKKAYFVIAAEPYNRNANEIYDLIRYNDNPATQNTTAAYYFQKSDTSTRFFNYFRNQTEAMQFLAEQQWQLFSIISEIHSSYRTQRSGDLELPYTTAFSVPVYYFKKAAARLD